MNRLLFLLLAALGVTLALLVWNNDSGATLGMENEAFARGMMLLTLLASMIAGGLWYRGTFTGFLRDAALWLAIFLAFAFLYQASPAIQAMFNN
jgi:aspartyl protease family protein